MFTPLDERTRQRIVALPECIRPHLTEGDPSWSSVPDGWHTLIRNLHENLVTIHPEYKILQVKSKWGGLCFYTNIPYDENDIGLIIISHYETLSSRTCEVCGDPAIRGGPTTIPNSALVATRCAEHSQQVEYNGNR